MTATPPRADLRTLAAEAPEVLARRFHEAYERLAPSFGYETREASAKPWEEVPANNRALMMAVCAEILADLLPEHRRVVLDEAADSLTEDIAWQRQHTDHDPVRVARLLGMEDAQSAIRRLAAAAPPDDLSGPVPAETAPAVPEDTTWRCACHPDVAWGWHPTSMGGGHRTIRGVQWGGLFRQGDYGAEEFDSVAAFRRTHPPVPEGAKPDA